MFLMTTIHCSRWKPSSPRTRKSRVDDSRHSGAEIYDGFAESTGSFVELRRHHYERLRDGNGSFTREKLAEKGNADNQIAMAQVFCNDAIQRIEMSAKNTIAGMLEGDDAKMLLVALKRFTKNNSPINTIAARQRIADTLIAANNYVFND